MEKEEKKRYISPTEISSWIYCELKWNFNKKYKYFKIEEVKQKISELKSRQEKTDEEKQELIFLNNLVSRKKILDKGIDEHDKHSSDVASIATGSKTSVYLIIAGVILILIAIAIIVSAL